MKMFFAMYWLLFMAIAAWWGQFPGLTSRPFTYPWLAVLAVSIVFAVLVLGLYALLSSHFIQNRWRRLVSALCYGLVLAGFSLHWAVTDLPGYYYALPAFGLSTFVLVLGITVSTSIKALWLKRGVA